MQNLDRIRYSENLPGKSRDSPRKVECTKSMKTLEWKLFQLSEKIDTAELYPSQSTRNLVYCVRSSSGDVPNKF